jgi:hypothetical protein
MKKKKSSKAVAQSVSVAVTVFAVGGLEVSLYLCEE